MALTATVFRALALATIAIAASSPQQPPQTAKSGQQTTSSPADTSHATAPVNVVQAAQVGAQAAHDSAEMRHERNETWIANGTAALAGFTLLLVAVTATLARFTFKLWKETGILAADTRQSGTATAEKMERTIEQATRNAVAMERSAVAMESSAAAAITSAATARVTLEHASYRQQKELRAYVSVRWEGLYAGNKAYEMLVDNVGRTPAVNLSLSMQYQVMTIAEAKAFDFPERDDGDDRGTIVIFPRDPRPFTSHHIVPVITDDAWRQVCDDTDSWLFLWGILRYWDIFGTFHWARYCLRFGGPYSFMGMPEDETRAPRWHTFNDSSEAPDPNREQPPEQQPP